MKKPETREVTRLLLEWREGDEAALNDLMPLVYDELRQIARAHMQRERPDHTLQPTEIVHEAFARLVDLKLSWKDRTHLLSMASRLMRRILVDHARARRSAKRGGGEKPVALDDERIVLDVRSPQRAEEFLRLDETLRRLEELDERQGRVVELHYFGGLGYDEIAEALQVSPATVGRDLRYARAWLRRELGA